MQTILYSLFALFLFSPVTGELWRIHLAGFDFLPSDLLILIITPLWLLDKLKNDRRLRLGKINKANLIFAFVVLMTYILNFFRFDPVEMKVGFSLLVRLAMYVFMSFMAFDLLSRDKTKYFQKILLTSMFSAMVLIVILGFLQLWYFPSFLELGLYLDGWDPHIDRLLSTWFDPNFISGFLAFMLCITIALTLFYHQKKAWRWAVILAAISLLGVIGLYLTFSRSGYLAFLFGLGLLALFKSRKLLVAMFIVVMLAFTFSSRVQERALEAVDSAKGLFGLNEQKPLDPTAELRVYSWKFASYIIADYPLLGAGYGRYAFEINHRGHGLLSDHQSNGSDSSLLTIWAQTGIFGLLTFLNVGFVAAVMALKYIRKKTDFQAFLKLGILAGFAGLMIHSIFVNSLLFALMMVYLWPALVMLEEPN